MRFLASDVAAATSGELVGEDVVLDGVAFDSREVRPGQLFVPLVALRDGHNYTRKAIDGGAAAYLSARGDVGPAPRIEVADTLAALMALAADRREHFKGTVIGVTGSVGKTSTKDLARAALSAGRRTWANEQSFNNDFGLPTTLLNAPDDTEVMVLEMGMRGPGEIARLCAIARPTVGVVTRVAEAHSERLGGIEGVARAKGELVAALPPDGVALLNADDERVAAMGARTEARSLTFGTTPGADLHIADLQLDELARPRFTLETPWGSQEVALGYSGAHMALNAAAALGCAGVLDVDLAAAAAALSELAPAERRMQLATAASGGVVINDSYNANPTSMRAGLDALAAMPAERRVAVLGVMAEIHEPRLEHRAIAAYARKRGIELVAVGTGLYGVAPVADPAAAVGPVRPGLAVLVKASNAAGLGVVADALIAS